jgi:hypothetical protein
LLAVENLMTFLSEKGSLAVVLVGLFKLVAATDGVLLVFILFEIFEFEFYILH